MKKGKNTKKIMAISAMFFLTMLIFAEAVVAGNYEVEGDVKSVIDHGDGTVTVKMDTSGNGKVDFTRTFTATSEQIQTLKDAVGKRAKIMYHNASDGTLVIDSVQVINRLFSTSLYQLTDK